MNYFNRFITTALLLALIALAVGALGIVAGLLLADPSWLGQSLAAEANALAAADQERRLIIGSVAAAALLAALVLLRYELLPRRRGARPFRVEEDADGATTIDRDSVRTLIERTVAHLEDVEAVKASITVDGDLKTLSLHCRVVARSTAVATELGPTIRRVVAERIEQQLGLPVARVTTRIRFLPPDEHVLL